MLCYIRVHRTEYTRLRSQNSKERHWRQSRGNISKTNESFEFAFRLFF